MGCSLPDSSVHGISQSRILKWVAIPFTRGLNPGFLHCRRILYHLSHQGKDRFPEKTPQLWLSDLRPAWDWDWDRTPKKPPLLPPQASDQVSSLWLTNSSLQRREEQVETQTHTKDLKLRIEMNMEKIF